MPSLTRDEISRLSAPERLALIGDIWDSFSDAELPTPPAQRQELARRLASLEQETAQAVSWEDLRAELAARVI
jgi:putative addiction module component (TIGR02574 family)